MNAIKIKQTALKKELLENHLESPLKYLSNSQRVKANIITKEWKLYTHEIIGEIYNKI